jgi:hypothetical protein
MTDFPDMELTVRELAKLWGVTNQCVYNWRKSRRVHLSRREGDDRWVAQEREAKAAKVIRTTDAKRWLEKRGVPQDKLDLQVELKQIESRSLETNGEELFSFDGQKTVERLYREAHEGDAGNPPQPAPMVAAPGRGTFTADEFSACPTRGRPRVRPAPPTASEPSPPSWVRAEARDGFGVGP